MNQKTFICWILCMLTIFLHRTAFPNANNLKAVLSIVEMSVKKERLSIENVLQDSFTKKPW